MTDPLARQGARPAPAAVAADHRRQPPPPDRPAHRSMPPSSGTRSRSATSPTTVPAAGVTPSATRSSSPPAPRTSRSGPWPMRSHMPTASATSSTGASRPRSSSTASPTACSARSASTSAASRSPTSQAGAKTARSTRSASTPRRSTRSPGRSRPPSTRSPSRQPTRSPAKPRGVAAAFGRGLLAPMIGQARPADRRSATRTRATPPAGLTRVGAHAAPDRTPRAERLQRPGPRGDEDELYRRHHRDLHRAVAHAVNAPRELIEDACQNAWAILLRAQPERDLDLRLAARGREARGIRATGSHTRGVPARSSASSPVTATSPTSS